MLKLTVTAMSLMLCGCTATTGLFSGNNSDSADSSGAESPIDTQALALYLELMHNLIEGDEVTRAEILSDIEDAADDAPTTTNRLKEALAHSMPVFETRRAYAESAAIELRELLAEEALLLPEERVLAAIHLAEVEQRLILELSAEAAQQVANDELSDRYAEAEQRIAALEQDNAALRRELSDTRAILDEISNIERSLRDRENDPDQ